MKVIITAGGTGGHIYPALAIIDEIKKNEKNLEVIYIGTHNRMEKEIVKKKGIRFEEIEIYGISKKDMLRNAKNFFLINKAYNKCLNLMDTFKPDIVIGTGGYVIYPVIKAAKKRKIKTFLHEQNSVPGKSNMWLSKNIDLVGVSFKNTEKFFEKSKYVFYSGNPCASSAINSKEVSKKNLNLSDKKKFILIVSGSLGSTTINNIFKKFLKFIDDKPYEVIYVTGASHYEEFIKNEKFPKNVQIKPFIENLPGVMKSCDLIISRAGASTISEILALNKPSILIPSPYVANNHQYFNALDLSESFLSSLIEEKKLTVEVLEREIEKILKKENYELMKQRLESQKKLDSANLIYKKIKEVIK